MMYVILGEGEMPAADLKASLDDLEAQAVQDQATFWVTVRATAEPTATDRALMAWVHAHETYYETVGPEANSADPLYSGTQEKHAVKGVGNKIVELMQTKPEEGEEAVMLALFASDDPEAPEDAELYAVVEKVLEAGFSVLALNDGLAEIGLTEGEGGDEEEAAPEPVTAPVKKAAARAVQQQLPGLDDVDELWATRENLEGLNIDEIKVIASRFGITLPPRTRQQTYISAILDRNEPEPTPPEAEIEIEEDVAPSNGQSNGQAHDPLDLVRTVLRSLGEALISISR